MEFNTLVKTKFFFPILRKYGFEIVEEFKNILRFQSSTIKIDIVHNPFENSNSLWVGKKDKGDEIEINNNTLTFYFKSNLKLSEVPNKAFINNLITFFENEGKSLLIGNEREINDLEKFNLVRSKKYTLDLLHQQNLNEADKAWSQKDFKKFISIINKFGYEQFPKSYLLKYRIAKEKI